jgi:hypothetical protein
MELKELNNVANVTFWKSTLSPASHLTFWCTALAHFISLSHFQLLNKMCVVAYNQSTFALCNDTCRRVRCENVTECWPPPRVTRTLMRETTMRLVVEQWKSTNHINWISACIKYVTWILKLQTLSTLFVLDQNIF